jgi:leucine efflux protein
MDIGGPTVWGNMGPMLGITDPLTYLLGTVAIILLPGPNSIFVLTTAARSGVKAGYRAAGGVFLGDSVLMMAAALGVASLLRAYPPVFAVVKYLGGAYLIYIGIGMVRAAVKRWRSTGAGDEPEPAEKPEPAVPRPFRRALVVSLVNPKAILFFISFFIQFVDPTYPHPLVSFAVLALILQVCSFAYLTALILGGNFLATQFRRRRRLSSALSTGVAAIFIGFGVKLATATLS